MTLLGENLHQESPLLRSLLDRLVVNRRSASMQVYAQGNNHDIVQFRSGVEFVEKILHAFPGMDFYFESDDKRVLGYSSNRDTLSVLAVRDDLVRGPQEIAAWDRAFEQTLREVGVGFGSEGAAYARQLLGELPPERGERLTRAIEVRRP